jgi:hypothetical protein
MDHRKLRESEIQYERAMNIDIKECDNHMKKEKLHYIIITFIGGEHRLLSSRGWKVSR